MPELSFCFLSISFRCIPYHTHISVISNRNTRMIITSTLFFENGIIAIKYIDKIKFFWPYKYAIPQPPFPNI